MEQILKEEAIKNNIPIITDEVLEFISNYIKENNVKTILEIGSATGYSSICFAFLNTQVTTIERDTIRYNKAIENIKKYNLESSITIKNVDALDYRDNNKYDLIFIDGAKSKYIDFFEIYKNNLVDNGVIITDNLSFHGMVEDISLTNNKRTKSLIKKIRKYIEFLENNKEFNTTFYKIGDGMSVSKKTK